MKKPKFRSLTMRIWTTFTAIILAIILGISVIYMVAYRNIDEQSKMQDLKVAHNIMMNNKSYELSTRFDELRNLKGVDYFVAQLDGQGGLTIISRQKEDQGYIDAKGEILPPPMTNVGGMDVKTWMSGFIVEGSVLDGVQYKETFNSMEFVFIVSSIEDYDASAADTGLKSYLVTYVPINRDNTCWYGYSS